MALLGPRCTQHLFPTKCSISRSHPSFLLLHHTAALVISLSLIPSVLATPVMKSHGAGEAILFWRRSVPHGQALVAVAPMLGSSGRQAMEPETHDFAATWRHWKDLEVTDVLLPPTKKWRLFGFKSFQGHTKWWFTIDMIHSIKLHAFCELAAFCCYLNLNLVDDLQPMLKTYLTSISLCWGWASQASKILKNHHMPWSISAANSDPVESWAGISTHPVHHELTPFHTSGANALMSSTFSWTLTTRNQVTHERRDHVSRQVRSVLDGNPQFDRNKSLPIWFYDKSWSICSQVWSEHLPWGHWMW